MVLELGLNHFPLIYDFRLKLKPKNAFPLYLFVLIRFFGLKLSLRGKIKSSSVSCHI